MIARLKKPFVTTSDLHGPLQSQVYSSGQKHLVLEELDRILTSPVFSSASRCKQFLSYVVQKQLDGHPESLKERTIGTEVFRREPDYATGDDPVVRVQAGEVRRRLEQYYQGASEQNGVRIALPVGSYSPAFHWADEKMNIPPALFPVRGAKQTPDSPPRGRHLLKSWRFLALSGLCLVLLTSGVLVWLYHQQRKQEQSAVSQFWAPVFNTQQPVLICLSKSVVYRPGQEVYRRYEKYHPGSFDTEVQRDNNPLQMGSNEAITWGDLYQASDFGVAIGDSYAAINLSGFLGTIGKPRQVRIGSSYSYEDLRNSPAVVVGAFNNKWTMQLTANMHFIFSEDNGDFSIREAPPGNRVWHAQDGAHGESFEDFAIVSRLMNSKTGQFTVIVAGISSAGTQAAAEFVSNARLLDQGIRNAPPEWQRRNVEFVLETTVIDDVAGPPRVVAAYWGSANN